MLWFHILAWLKLTDEHELIIWVSIVRNWKQTIMNSIGIKIKINIKKTLKLALMISTLHVISTRNFGFYSHSHLEDMFQTFKWLEMRKPLYPLSCKKWQKTCSSLSKMRLSPWILETMSSSTILNPRHVFLFSCRQERGTSTWHLLWITKKSHMI